MIDPSDATSLDQIPNIRRENSSPAATRKATLESREARELRRACQEFEEIFLRLVLKEAKIDRSLFSQDGASSLYGDMARETLAKAMAQAGGLGLAEMLYRQLSAQELQPTQKDSSANMDTTLNGESK